MKHEIWFMITTRNEAQSLLDTSIFGLGKTTASYGREISVIDDCGDLPVACTHSEVIVLRNRQPRGGLRHVSTLSPSQAAMSWRGWMRI